MILVADIGQDVLHGVEGRHLGAAGHNKTILTCVKRPGLTQIFLQLGSHGQHSGVICGQELRYSDGVAAFWPADDMCNGDRSGFQVDNPLPQSRDLREHQPHMEAEICGYLARLHGLVQANSDNLPAVFKVCPG